MHASGHAKPHDLIRFINETNPEELILIHTNHAELFGKPFKNEKLKIILPTRDMPIELYS
ncbi:MAG: MBL fold metallo-hydrolase RNA specificity domain-containing protein [Promethearchaeota archaeon]